jgi:purine nucleoside phosphorylase
LDRDSATSLIISASSFTIPYGDIPHWPASRVIGHAGKLVGGTAAGRRVLALSGRVHHYEGHDMQTVTFAMRVMGRLGVPRVILTNACRRHFAELFARRLDGDRRSHQSHGR